MDKYPLITQRTKKNIFFVMLIIVYLNKTPTRRVGSWDIVKNKQHLSEEGLRKIVSLKASLNRGLSPILEDSFANVIPYPKLSVSDFKIKDPQWLAGFSSAEGCFLIRIIESSTHQTGYQIVLVFKLIQHSKDE